MISHEEVECMLQQELNILSGWFNCNELNVNCKETKCMLLTSSRSRFQYYDMGLYLNGSKLECAQDNRYLGQQVDMHLSVCAKVNSITKILYLIHDFIPK